ncbi:hypothetical protein I307_04743 [Cryptococcus deuterogattii 99/473]|uniref:Uncharacterized protein n=1 Tax=Cryptococcus deuterogattii Ram5 TaxID=1296110 RepID=A0A0D0UXX4_9TREE|nr:hypothetical protein I309_05107 [Cryptococcus deuterogattii LA55]KIR31270.1 hypothetical protein I352_06364 [Cryptococcus deuterogattii MMRL2647]KIR40156.1 hypothetical protein I313_04077 [Cryptococcus deuterogattii Ram5]KIR71550.1 hypothetical protein I310_04857 [Cryptococcus deuterogattii CA1014]KIR91131.1 hypothetical protein I304_05227 [Cryptococcus deuterogattii CBS 10090]KIR96406.1 hypothetical protein L804_06241 [Cryptococcus deuterogattii 2001/935-1]KIY55804.1 hypothetical protein 
MTRAIDLRVVQPRHTPICFLSNQNGVCSSPVPLYKTTCKNWFPSLCSSTKTLSRTPNPISEPSSNHKGLQVFYPILEPRVLVQCSLLLYSVDAKPKSYLSLRKLKLWSTVR